MPQFWPPVPPRRESGVVAIVAEGSSGTVFYSTDVPITFTPGMFTAQPFVEFSYDGFGLGWPSHGSTSTSVSGTSVRAYRLNSAPAGFIRWRAVQD